MGELPVEEEGTGVVWMVRAGRQGALTPTFIERSMIIVGWGRVGDVSAMTRDELIEAVAEGSRISDAASEARLLTRCGGWCTRCRTATW